MKSSSDVYAELGIPRPDHATNIYTMAAELLAQQPEGSVLPPQSEVIVRALDTIAHWYSAQEPTKESAQLAAELVKLLCHRYDQFWPRWWELSTRDDYFYEAAHNAVDRGIEFRSMVEVSWWMQNHRPPDPE